MNKFKQIVKLIIGYFHLIILNRKLDKVLNEVEIIFFFPFYHTGGAEKVHASIVQALQPKKSVVIFTKASATSNMLPLFVKYAKFLELNPILNKRNEVLHDFLTKSIARKINKSKTVKTIFSSNADYFYKILPNIDSHIKKIDLFHAFSVNDYREKIIVESAQYISTRVVINQFAKSMLLNYYSETKAINFSKNIQIISNGVELLEKKIDFVKTTIRIGFIGRWSEEKRPELFLKAAKILKKKYPEVNFFIAGSGTNPNRLQIEAHQVELLGDISDLNLMNELYLSTSVLVLTSVYEGFPMVFMEGMAFGCVPVSTNVGGISDHICNGSTGFLIDSTNEDEIVTDLVTYLVQLIENPKLMQELGENCKNYAHCHFSINQFKNAYKILLD